MNKKYLKIGLIAIIILYLVGVSFYILKTKNQENGNQTANSNVKDMLTKKEIYSMGLFYLGNYEVLSRDESGKPLTYQIISLKERKPISLELMDKTEKAKMNIAETEKIQVLERDENGQVLVYKVIKNDTDIDKSY
jgi:hypothetical protein